MDIDQRLRLWGRVVTITRHPTRSVGSLEGHYRSPQPWEEPVQAIAPPITAKDMADAWEVEAAWATLSMPHRIILRSHYCWRAHRAVAVRMLRRINALHASSYALELIMAQNAITEALRRTERQNRNRLREIVRKVLALVSDNSYKEATTGARPQVETGIA